MTFKEWKVLIHNYQTRIAGYLTVFLGALQASSPHLQQVLSVKGYNLTMIACGLLVALIGHRNARR